MTDKETKPVKLKKTDTYTVEWWEFSGNCNCGAPIEYHIESEDRFFAKDWYCHGCKKTIRIES